jgi:hypothetical protein
MANLLVFVFDRVKAYCCTRIDAVHMVDAATDGIYFDQSDTHDLKKLIVVE